MRDYQPSLERIRKDAAEAALIRDNCSEKAKRDIFARLHEHLNMLADEVERVIAKAVATPRGE